MCRVQDPGQYCRAVQFFYWPREAASKSHSVSADLSVENTQRVSSKNQPANKNKISKNNNYNLERADFPITELYRTLR